MENFFENKENAVDTLTKVFSREIIVEYVHYLIAEKIPFSMALVDIDNFKYVNDSYGHLVGDIVLEKIAHELNELVTKRGFIGRFGGDEFIIIYPNITEYDEIWNECHRTIAKVAECSFTDYPWLSVTITMGVSRFPENATVYEQLFSFADKALYRGKMKGRNCFIIYLPEKHAKIVLKTENDKTLSSMFLHSNVIKLLSSSPSLKDGIENLFSFLSAYFMLDYMCIQSAGKVYFQKLHQLAPQKMIKPITERFFCSNKNPSTGIFYVNQIKHLLSNNEKEFYDELKAQKIHSSFCCEISCCKETYGFLRVDIKDPRIWQNTDMDILVSAAKIIGLLLHERKLRIEDL